MQYNFSVVIPSYNLGKTLERTIDSVLNQTLNNIEIVVVDDASTDNDTIDVLTKYKNKVSKVIFLEKNGGVAHTRNVGIKNSNAPYILCLDSDDYIDLTYLEKAKKIFDVDDSIGVVSCWYQTFGCINDVWKYKDGFNIKKILAVNQIPSGSCVRKKVFDEVGLFDENSDISGYDDWELWIRIFSYTNWKYKVIQEPLFFYFVRWDSIQHSADDKKNKRAMQVILEKHKQLYIDNFIEIFSNLHADFVNRGLMLKRNRELIDMIINSKSYKLGNLFFRSVQKPYKLITYPYNFIKILLEK